MADCIIVGCDLHVKNALVKIAVDRDEPIQRSYRNNRKGRDAMAKALLRLARRHGATRVVFVYEASSLGFRLYDEMTALGFECYVLAPSKIARSWKQRCSKTDERDAQLLLELARGHVLAGNPLPSVWVPPPQLRDDREITRPRIDVSEKITAVKNQIQSLLKRHDLRRPANTGKAWTLDFLAWLNALVMGPALPVGASVGMGTLLAQLAFLEQEAKHLDEHLARLAQSDRYRAAASAMMTFRGVGIGVAMTFLVEVGDMDRFSNRRQLGSYLGLVPKSNESGEGSDRKGHITHHGPPRVRKMLCQAVCSWVRWDPAAAAMQARLTHGLKSRKKIARVAMMRRMAIRLWHAARNAKRPASKEGGTPT